MIDFFEKFKIPINLLRIFFIKVNIYEKDELKNSCIHLIAQSGSLKVLEFLYEKYFDLASQDHVVVFAQTLNIFHMTPLHSAAKVRLLLK